MTEAPEHTAPARVQKAGDWHLVTHGTWQISVGPDGLLMLPRHLHPRELDDFVRCAQVAKDVGNQVVAANEKKAQEATQKPALSARRAIIAQGPPPPGATRMRATSAQQRAASIGRDKRRGTRRAAAQQRGRQP